MVCDRNILIAISQSLFAVGSVVGLIMFSWIGDLFGRKIVFFLGQLLMCIFGIAMSFANNYAVFAAMQLLTAVFASVSILLHGTGYLSAELLCG